MIKIVCPTGVAYDLRVVETESGVDLSRFVSNIQIMLDPKSRCFIARVDFHKVELDFTAWPAVGVQPKEQG